MRLAYLSSRYGGAGDTFIRAEVVTLREIGHEVHTFSIRRPPASELLNEEIRREHEGTDYVLERGALVLLVALLRAVGRTPARVVSAFLLSLALAAPGVHGRVRAIAYVLEAAYLAHRLRALGVEHLHNHIGGNSATVAALTSHLTGIAFSFTVHGANELLDQAPSAMREKMRRAAFVVAVSDDGRGHLLRWADRRDWQKIHVVRCGVDRRFVSPGAPPRDVPRLVAVGRLSPEKGHLVLVDALAHLAAEGEAAEVAVIGDGPLRSTLEHEAERLGIRELLRFTGWLGPEDIAAEILAARALVLPSFSEGLPMVVIEALAMGRPVVATRIGAVPELVEPGSTGWLVPPGSAEALSRAMRAALSAAPGELERMGRLGRAAVLERHDLTREVRRLEALLAGRRGEGEDVSSRGAPRRSPSGTRRAAV
jgi:glycosyltransferase involved in cell wall biosynthesis